MVKKKRQSKRLTLHKKHKIIKKVKEHKRKLRKQERQHPKKKKDVGIPNNWPFKQEMLHQLEQARLVELEAKEKLKEQKKKEKERLKLQQQAELNALQQVPDMTPQSLEMQMQQARQQAIADADLILFVLDARDPQACRSLSFEDGALVKGNKNIALVLNKLDLVDPEIAQKWIKYLRRFHPVIPVKAFSQAMLSEKTVGKQGRQAIALQEKIQHLGGLRDNGDITALHAFISEYQIANEKKDENTTIALMGYPNVGKSALFNALKRRPLAEVSMTPGTTKALQSAEYTAKVTLLDCPPLDPECSEQSAYLMRHGIAGSYLMDPMEAVEAIVSRCDSLRLMQMFRISMFKNHEEFLAKLARKRSMLRKGGDPNVLLAARTFLKSLGDGSTPFNCIPPQSKGGFVMPQWYTNMNASKVEAFHSKNFASDKLSSDHLVLIKSTSVSNPEGDTLEFDIAIGKHKLHPIPEGAMDEESEDEEECQSDEESKEVCNSESDEEMPPATRTRRASTHREVASKRRKR